MFFFHDSFRNSFLIRFIFFMCMRECLHTCMPACGPWRSGEGVRSHENGIRGNCKLPDVGARNWTQLLCESIVYSSPTSLSSPSFYNYLWRFTVVSLWYFTIWLFLYLTLFNITFPKFAVMYFINTGALSKLRSFEYCCLALLDSTVYFFSLWLHLYWSISVCTEYVSSVCFYLFILVLTSSPN